MTGDRDVRRPLGDEALLALEQPRRRPGETLLRSERDHRLPDVLVDPQDVHVLGPGLVRHACHLAHERRVLEERGDLEDLTALHVCADQDGQLGVTAQQTRIARGHGGKRYARPYS